MNGGAVKSDAGGNTIREAVRAMLAERIDADPDEIEWDDELTMLGVDSISLMAVLEWHLACTGIRIPFTDAVSSASTYTGSHARTFRKRLRTSDR